MHRVLIVVEGTTERAIIQQTIAPYLGTSNLSLQPKVVGKPAHKGGVRNFESVRSDILDLLKQERASYVSTFFDFYGLPQSWPGATLSKGRKTTEIAEIIESTMFRDIASRLGNSFNPTRFVPYVQMYELEALLFADPSVMASVFEREELRPQFERIVQDCGGCEEIDDGATTAPSKRIENLFPGYRKGSGATAHAPIIAGRIGVDSLRKACPHFSAWIANLERIGTAGTRSK